MTLLDEMKTDIRERLGERTEDFFLDAAITRWKVMRVF